MAYLRTEVLQKKSFTISFVTFHRAVNNQLLDTYQLKSLDGLVESSLSDMSLVQKGEKIFVTINSDDVNSIHYDNFALREPYDVVIRALGFTFDDTVFK